MLHATSVEPSRVEPGAGPTARPLDVAIAGTRGVPARYGGFETFAAELARRLVARGHRVTVYGRARYVGRRRVAWHGARVVSLAAVRQKHLETPLHALSSALAAARARHDVVLLCNAANAFAIPLFRATGARVVVNVDGIERLRLKWGALGRLWYALGERLSLAFADRAVADAGSIQDAYRARHGVELPVIPYGASPGARVEPGRELARLGLAPGGYVLQVGRLEPENHALTVVRAFRAVETPLRLAIVGDAPYAHDYKRALAAEAARDPRVLLAGAVYGRRYRELVSSAFAVVAAGEVGGTHPALLEAMALAPAVVANDVPEHREVLADAGLYYARNDEVSLARALGELVADPARREPLGRAARARVEARYSWPDVTLAYERLFHEVVSGERP